jgi:hypothetical protein
MTDDIVTRLRGIVADPKPVFTQDILADAADEIERLRKDRRELLEIAKLFADNGKCQQYEDEFGYCTHSSCDWHGAEHLWESFCMSRGI